MRLIDEVDIGYPIILDRNGRVIDGMHRVCRAARFATNPEHSVEAHAMLLAFKDVPLK